MLPKSALHEIAAIAADRVSGASTLAVRAAQAFGRLADDRPASREDLFAMAMALEHAQPAMASVRNVAYLCATLASERATAKEQRDVFRGVEQQAREVPVRVARQAMKIWREPGRTLTISDSSTVYHILRLAWDRGLLLEAFVLRSEPGSEGVRFARRLAEHGANVSVVDDDEAEETLDRCRSAIVGGDAILRDGGLVNKVGTRRLAEACRSLEKRCYAAVDTLKFDPRTSSSGWRPPDSGLYEVVPGDLLSAYITERGVFGATALVDVLGESR